MCRPAFLCVLLALSLQGPFVCGGSATVAPGVVDRAGGQRAGEAIFGTDRHHLMVGLAQAVAHNGSAELGGFELRSRHLRYMLPVPEGLDELTGSFVSSVHEQAIRRMQEAFTPQQLAELFTGRSVYLLPEDGPGLVLRQDAVFVNPQALVKGSPPEVVEALQWAEMGRVSSKATRDGQVLIEAVEGARTFGEIAPDERNKLRTGQQTTPRALRDAVGQDWGEIDSESKRSLAAHEPKPRRWDPDDGRAALDRVVEEELAIREALGKAESHVQHVATLQQEVPRALQSLREAEELLQRPQALAGVDAERLVEIEKALSSPDRYRHVLDLEERLRMEAVHERLVSELEKGASPEHGDLIAARAEFERNLEQFRQEVAGLRTGPDAIAQRTAHWLYDVDDLIQRGGLSKLDDDALMLLEQKVRRIGSHATLDGFGWPQVDPYLEVLDSLHKRGKLPEVADGELAEMTMFLSRLDEQVGRTERIDSPRPTDKLQALKSAVLEESRARHIDDQRASE